MSSTILSYILSFIGILGFWLSGKKIWWAWWINVGNQALWFIFALWIHQYGLWIGSLFFTIIFTLNAIKWTRERFTESPLEDKLLATGMISANEFRKMKGLE